MDRDALPRLHRRTPKRRPGHLERLPTVIAAGTTPVVGGIIANLDPTLLANGDYTLTLTAINTGGLR